MSGDSCALLAIHGLPVVVRQAQDDRDLPPAAKAVMWHAQYVLDLQEMREWATIAVAFRAGIKETTAGQMLTLLVGLGYLEESTKRKPRAFRLPWSRRTTAARAA